MRKIIAQIAIGGIIACYSVPALAFVNPCQFKDNRPKYCEEQKSNVNWMDFLTGIYALTKTKYHEPTPQQSLLNMIISMNSIEFDFPPPPLYMTSNLASNAMSSSSNTLLEGNSLSNNSIILHAQDSQIVDEKTAVEVANAERARKEAEQGNVTTTLSDTERARIESSAMATESNGYSAVISSAVSSGLCDVPNDLASASRCVLAASEKTGALNDGQNMLLFAAGAGDPAAKTLVANSTNGLFEPFHSTEDVDDIKKVIEAEKESKELLEDVKNKYGNYKTVINHAVDAFYAMEDVKQSVVNGKLTDTTFDRVSDYLNAKEKFIKSAKSIDDAGFGDYAKAEIDAAVEGNKILKKLKDKHIEIDKKIIEASDKLSDKAKELEDKYGQTHASQAMQNLADNLSLLGSASLGDKAQGVLNLQRELATIAQLAYSPDNQAVSAPTAEKKAIPFSTIDLMAWASAGLATAFGLGSILKKYF